MAADLFAYANGFFLGMGRRTSVWAAHLAASHNARGISYPDAFRRVCRVFARDLIDFADIKDADPTFYADCFRIRRWVRAAQRRS